MNSIKEIQDIWEDTPEKHQLIAETLYHRTNDIQELKDLRDWVETNSWGHGERSFYWMWWLLMQEVGNHSRYLEIGIYKSQMFALMRLIAELQEKTITLYGISPMNGAGGFEDRNYYKDGDEIQRKFNKPGYHSNIIRGYSTDEKIIKTASIYAQYDFVFIDGGHDFATVKSDLSWYPPLVKENGFLVIDDCCNNMNLPQGYFGGIQSVTDAVLDWEKTQSDFEFLFSIVHNKVYRRK